MTATKHVVSVHDAQRTSLEFGSRGRREAALVFGAIVAVVITFALYTDHRWEDWYTTFRASKSLALGKGLVFNEGERVHTFTSPLGTLVPAGLAFLTGGRNDEAVIWLYRILNGCLLGLTGVILRGMATRLRFDSRSTVLLVGLFGTHILIVDFAINGMETGFMMLFLAVFLRELLTPSGAVVRNLTVALAGLMYTRPDGFVYAGAIAAGFLAFQPKLGPTVRNRTEFLRLFVVVGSLSLLCYLPWLIWTWAYYGTPVPQTVMAKGSNISISRVGADFISFPYGIVRWSGTGRELFMPPYALMGGWLGMHRISLVVALCGALSFLFPVPKNARAVSLSVYLLHFYLNRISGQGGQPWYLPNLALPSILTLALVQDHLVRRAGPKAIRYAVLSASVLALAFNVMMLVLGARHLRLRQAVVEFGNREKIGTWLHDNAAPGDRVFLECLGYIGFYSGLKTYDYPGLSSPEVVSARKRLKSENYGVIIDALRPEWLVLRPAEVLQVQEGAPDLLAADYSAVKEFDVTSQVPSVLGHPYLACDAKFTVYHRK